MPCKPSKPGQTDLVMPLLPTVGDERHVFWPCTVYSTTCNEEHRNLLTPKSVQYSSQLVSWFGFSGHNCLLVSRKGNSHNCGLRHFAFNLNHIWSPKLVGCDHTVMIVAGKLLTGITALKNWTFWVDF